MRGDTDFRRGPGGSPNAARHFRKQSIGQTERR
nr:MAG TPA: hypothetical protein [Caudoviricetes sp.]